MKKILTAIFAVVVIGTAALATAGSAEARWYGRGGWGGGWGWRGGYWGPGPFFAGAVVGGALAAPYYYGGGYYPYAPYPYYGPGCRRYWNGYAWVRGCW
jgi:hypothetical protein